MITSLMFQDDAGTPVVLCNANTRTKEKHTAACYAARAAFLRSLYGHQPARGLINGYISSAKADGAIVVVEIGFHEYGYCTGIFELPIHIFKFQGQPVSSSMNVVDWVGRPVVLTVVNRYKFDGVYLSNIAAVRIEDSEARMELPCDLSAEMEA